MRPDYQRLRRMVRLNMLTALLGMLVHAHATAGPRTLGWLEWSWLEPGHIKVKAKLDSGAKTSSIHALDIESFQRDDAEWVRFRIPLEERPDDSDHGKDLDLERRVVRKTRIKDHERASKERYVVNMDLCIGGITFTTPVTLADRSRFNYPLLLGRIALSGRTIIDPAQVFTASKSCTPEDDS